MSTFLLSLLPKEKFHLLFITGTLCLLMSPSLIWRPPSSFVLYIASIPEGPLYLFASQVLVLYSAFACLVLCLYRTQELFRNFLLATTSAFAGLFFPLSYVFLTPKSSFRVDGKYGNLLPLGFYTALLGVVLISLGTIILKLKASEDSFPISLQKERHSEVEAQEAETGGVFDTKYALSFAAAIIMITSLGINSIRFSSWSVGVRSATSPPSSGLMYFLYFFGYALVVLTSPGLWALLMRWKISREGFKDAGLRWGRLKWYLIGVLLPLLVSGVSYAILYAVSFHIPETWKEPYDFRLLTDMRSFNTLGVILFLLFSAFGEELGWRSYLQPKLVRQFGFYRGIFLVAFVWWIWHFPSDLARMSDLHSGYAAESSSFIVQAFGLLCFLPLRLALIAAYSFMLGHLYIRSGSVFTVTLMHASMNAVHFMGISFTKYDDIVLVAVWALGAYLLLRWQKLRASTPLAGEPG